MILTVACAGSKGTGPSPLKPTASASSSGPTSAGGIATAIVVGRAKLTPLVSDGWQAVDALELEPGKTLYVGSSGQRWLATEHKAPTEDDPENTKTSLAGASSMAPETLVAARKRDDGSFFFVGESGAIYLAATALGDLTTRRAPPEPLRAVAAGKSAIVGITLHDTLIRSTDGGATFVAVTTPKTEAVPTQIVGNPRGELLAFFAPAHMVASFDDGATFAAVPNVGLGPAGVFAAANGALYVRGYSVSPTKPPGLASLATTSAILAKAGGSAPTLEKSKGGLYSVARPIEDADRLELATGVQGGRAVFDGLRYLEVRAAPDGESLHAVTLEKGKITQHPPVVATKGCDVVSVASAGDVVEFACTKFNEAKKVERDQFLLFRSTDFGKTFTSDGVLETGATQTRVLINAAGHVAVAGACLQAGCSDDPLLVRPAGTKAFVAAKFPADHRLISAQQLRFGAGDRLYALADNDEGTLLSLLVSKDAGRTFVARLLPRDDDSSIGDVQELALDEKAGSVSLFTRNEPTVRLTTNNDGASWTTSELPFVADWMSIAGARGLATSDGVGYETLDSGATWGVVSLPTNASVGGTLPVVCGEQGCMLGDVALREGWEFATKADVRPAQKAQPKTPALAHRPLVECSADGAPIELGTASEPFVDPSPSIAFATIVERDKGALDVVTWPRAGKTIAKAALLPAANDPMATKRFTSPDGIVVVRAPRNGDAKSPVDLELAWWVASTGKIHRATLAKAGTPAGKWGSVNGVATIVPGFGVYVRIAGGTDAVTHLARESGAVSKVSLPPTFPSLQRMSARRVGSETIFVGAPNESAALERVAAFAILNDKNEAKTFTWGLWPRIPRGRSEVSYGDQVLVTWPGSDTIAPRHFALSLKSPTAEPPEPTSIPLVRDLPLCDASATGPRIELPWTNGSRTPVVIKHGTRTIFHATNSTAVRNGKTPCASSTLAGPLGTMGEWTVLDLGGTRGFFLARDKTHALVPLTCATKDSALPAPFTSARGFSR